MPFAHRIYATYRSVLTGYTAFWSCCGDDHFAFWTSTVNAYQALFLLAFCTAAFMDAHLVHGEQPDVTPVALCRVRPQTLSCRDTTRRVVIRCSYTEHHAMPASTTMATAVTCVYPLAPFTTKHPTAVLQNTVLTPVCCHRRRILRFDRAAALRTRGLRTRSLRYGHSVHSTYQNRFLTLNTLFDA